MASPSYAGFLVRSVQVATCAAAVEALKAKLQSMEKAQLSWLKPLGLETRFLVGFFSWKK